MPQPVVAAPRPATSPRRAAAFLDLDKTIIATSSVFAFNRPLLDEGLLTPRTLIKMVSARLGYALSSGDDEQMDKLAEALADATKGWSREQVEAIVTEALTEIVRPTVFAEARELLADHRRAGHDLVILSASGEELVAPIARMLGVDHYAGTRMALDEDGRYAGRVEFYCQGQGKVEAMREFARRYGYDLAASHAYSDSITDLPMLSEVGHPAVVNPDRALRREALERGWPILSFTQEDPLLDRVSSTSGTVISIGSVLAVVGAAVVAVARAGRD